MKFIKVISATLIILFICFGVLPAQENSLYLVGTITGTSEENRIYGAKGIGDINNDGFADFQVTLKSCTNIYLGSADFDTVADYSFTSTLVYPVGDVNGDGFDDLIARFYDKSNYPALPIFKLFRGGKQLDTSSVFIYSPPALLDMLFASKIENIGDLNGDGYRDFIISSYYNWSDEAGRVYIFCGGDSISDEPVKILTNGNSLSGWDINFGISVIGIGDINNDKYDDLLIYQDPKDPDSGKVFLYYGCKDLDTMHSKLFPPKGQWFGTEIQNTGDMNGDGNDEFIILSSTEMHIYLNEDSTVVNHNIIGWCGAGGDINGDGYDDLLISDGHYKNENDSIIGLVYGFYGSSKIDTIYDFRIYGTQPYSSFGYDVWNKSLCIAGDINGDGYDDVLISASAYRVDGKSVGKIYIYSYKNIASVKINDKTNKVELFKVNQNYPNPFNPRTVIGYQLSVTGSVKIKIHDIQGKEIARINEGIKPPGEYRFTFDSDKYNLTSGAYFIVFTAEPLNNSNNTYRKVIKVLLLK